MKLTGANVASCLNLKWEKMSDAGHDVYEVLAEELNNRYFLPLQQENEKLRCIIESLSEEQKESA